MEYFSCKDLCGAHGHACVKPLKEELASATAKWLQVISAILLLYSYTTKEVKNKAILS